MRALITGASSGIGKEISYELAKRKIDLCLVARRYERLLEIKNDIELKFGVNVEIYGKDLSKEKDVFSLCEETGKVDILVNNAGFGKIGNFIETSLNDELEIIDVNVKALHILTKKYIEKMDGEGYILNVASIAAFMPGGPLLSSYYASKAYVLSLSQSINEELKYLGKNISVSTLCPGPVNTEFNSVAGVKFNLNSLTAQKVARIAVKKMFKRKRTIIPGLTIKFSQFAQRIIPTFIMLKITHKMQKKKVWKEDLILWVKKAK